MKELVVTMIRPEMARGAVGELAPLLHYRPKVIVEVFDESGRLQTFRGGPGGAQALRRWGGTPK